MTNEENTDAFALSARRGTTAIVYGAVLVASTLLFFFIRQLGSDLYAPVGPMQEVTKASASGNTLLHVLLAMLMVIVASALLGALFRWVHQPAVVGEIVAGIMLGPSMLGRVAPEIGSYVFSPAITPLLGVLAQVGVILFMFLVGLELNTGILRKKGHAALAISHASIVAPFLLGGGLALWLYPRVSPPGVRFDVFALFMGVAMSITAFPVLARILTDRGMQKTPLGVLALSCAAVDDLTAWCLLALIVSAANPAAGGAVYTIGFALLFMTVMFTRVRPWIQRAVRDERLRGTVGRDEIAIVLVALLVSALITELIGIHAVFGAFLLGAVVPHDSRLAITLKQQLSDVVTVLLLPAFFAFTGLRTQIGLLSTSEDWLMCAAIIAVACAGKLGGSYVAARLTGVEPREAASLGLLMNTRGLMELVVLNIGLDLGVISPRVFAMMVLMALVTTFMTAPLLAILRRNSAEPAGPALATAEQ